MTTTDLIKILKEAEFGFTGRTRELFCYLKTDVHRVYLGTPEIKIVGGGDGCAGAQLILEVVADIEDECEVLPQKREKRWVKNPKQPESNFQQVRRLN